MRRKRCDNCGQLFNKDELIFDKDPYLEELFPEDENPEQWWCEKCYQEQLDDI